MSFMASIIDVSNGSSEWPEANRSRRIRTSSNARLNAGSGEMIGVKSAKFAVALSLEFVAALEAAFAANWTREEYFRIMKRIVLSAELYVGELCACRMI